MFTGRSWNDEELHVVTICVESAKLHKNFTLREEAGLSPATSASSAKRTTTVNNWFSSRTPFITVDDAGGETTVVPGLVYNSCGLTPSQTGRRINICTVETRTYPRGTFRGLDAATESAISTSSSCSVLTMGLSCLNVKGRSTYGWTTDRRQQPSRM